MTDVAVDRLRIRGPDARRLAAVAARQLPAALDALGDLDDVRLETIIVRLDLDPVDYDDATLAVLWADAIRVQVLAAGGRALRSPTGGSPDRQAPPSDTASLPSPVWSAEDVAAVSASWLARPSADALRVPRPLLRLARPQVAMAVAVLLGDATWSRLVARLRTALSASVRSASPAVAAGEDSPAAATGRRGTADADTRSTAPARCEPFDPPPGSAAEAATEAPTPDRATAPGLAAVAEHLDTLGDLVDDVVGEVDLATVTRAAGLVLLWPWLADVCREALRSAPSGEAHRLRAHVLARLADPDDPGLLDDPLVRLLAGVPDLDQVTAPPPGPWLPTVDECGTRVLAAFAGLLPGFESSSPRFVRDQWVVRLGLLDATTTPAELVSATHPLDVLLPKLPYPVALFKLPWSPPVSVRFRP